MEIVKLDQVTTPPTLTGTHGRAWGIPLSTLREKMKWPPEIDPTVSSWLIERPDAHPFWHSYLLYAIHLRELPNKPPATIRKPGATHEFWLYAADPDFPRELIVKGEAPGKRMVPVNFCAQFKTTTDASARAFISTRIVIPVIYGHLNPDTDARAQWITLFGQDAIVDGATSINTGLLQ